MPTETERIAAAEAEGRDFYVTIIDGSKVGLLAGPFRTQAEAARWVAPARELAYELSPRQAEFSGFGTSSLPAATGRVGKLNDRLGVAP